MALNVIRLSPGMQADTGPLTDHLSVSDSDLWGQYVAVRNYLLSSNIDEGTYYGFIDTDAFGATGIDVLYLQKWLMGHPGEDAYIFYPYDKDSACFLNPFEHGDYLYGDVMKIAHTYLAGIGLDLDVPSWPVTFKTTSDIHHIVATPSFWLTWFDLTEKLYEILHDPHAPLLHQFPGLSQNNNQCACLMNGIASLVLSLDQALKIGRVEYQSGLSELNKESALHRSYVLLNDLKEAYSVTREQQYLDQFFNLRNQAMLENEPELVHPKNETVLFNHDAIDHWPDDVFYACTSHVPLFVEFPEQIHTFYLGDQQQEGRLNMRDYAAEWEEHYRSVAGMTALFAIRTYIKTYHPTIQRVGMCMYRKFISKERISGIQAEDNWMMDVISDAHIEQMPLMQMLHPGNKTLLVGKPCAFNVGGQPAGYLRHYAYAHHAEDLLRLTAIALELGVFSKDDVTGFLEEKEFFIGGLEIGVFPAAFWLNAVDQIERVIRECVRQHPNHREGYQRRSWAFCAERLSSYLLAKYIRQHYPDPQVCYGQLNLLTESNATQYVAGGLLE
jgi:hypothetical protein